MSNRSGGLKWVLVLPAGSFLHLQPGRWVDGSSSAVERVRGERATTSGKELAQAPPISQLWWLANATQLN